MFGYMVDCMRCLDVGTNAVVIVCCVVVACVDMLISAVVLCVDVDSVVDGVVDGVVMLLYVLLRLLAACDACVVEVYVIGVDRCYVTSDDAVCVYFNVIYGVVIC